MKPKRVLVVYYSRTGTTREVARAIRDELGADVERIADRKRRRGVAGYLQAGFDALRQRSAVIGPMNTDPGDYDLVIVGTPIWNASVTPAVRAYLEANRERLRRVAFFCTASGVGRARVFRQMEAICGKAPLATLMVTADEVRDGDFAAVHAFVSALTSGSVAPPTRPATRLRTLPA